MHISDWSSDVCSSDLIALALGKGPLDVVGLHEGGETSLDRLRHRNRLEDIRPGLRQRLAFGGVRGDGLQGNARWSIRGPEGIPDARARRTEIVAVAAGIGAEKFELERAGVVPGGLRRGVEDRPGCGGRRAHEYGGRHPRMI